MSHDLALRQVEQKNLKKKARLGYITAQKRRKKSREWGRIKERRKAKGEMYLLKIHNIIKIL